MEMRGKHGYDASFVLQYILHELEQLKPVNIKELAYRFEYDPSSIYKLIKKIDQNFCMIDNSIKIKRLGGGIFKLIYDDEEIEK